MAERKADHKHEVGLQRPHGFYISDNELVDKLAAEIGIYAFGVYHMLMRRAENRAGASVSLREISRYLAISKDAAANALATLRDAGLVREVPAKERNTASTYLIVHAKDVVINREENPQLPQPRPEFRTRKRTRRVLDSGHAASLIQDTRVLDSGHPRPEFRTPNKEVNKNIKQVQDNSPLPPSRGVEDYDEDLEQESPQTPKSERQPPAPPKPSAKAERAADEPFDLQGGLKRLGARTSAAARPTIAGVRASFNGVLGDLRSALIDASLANVHKHKPGLRDGAEEFRRYFEDTALADYEAAEGASEQILLVVRSRDPAATRKGFTIYRGRIERAMVKYFGRVVQVRFEEG